MTLDIAKLRATAERYANDDAREDLDAQEWGEAMPTWNVLALIAEIERLRGERDEARQEARANVMAADRAEAERDADVGNYRVVNAAIERDTAERIATWLENRASAVDWVNANETATAIRADAWKRGGA